MIYPMRNCINSSTISFAIESIGVKLPEREVETHAHTRAWEMLEKLTHRCEHNRYELLWKIDYINLPNLYFMARNRLKHLEMKLERDEILRKVVYRQIEKYLV